MAPANRAASPKEYRLPSPESIQYPERVAPEVGADRSVVVGLVVVGAGGPGVGFVVGFEAPVAGVQVSVPASRTEPSVAWKAQS
jgi:hypothetical protein